MLQTNQLQRQKTRPRSLRFSRDSAPVPLRMIAVTSIKPITLTGRYVVLEPLRQDHHDGLVEAVRDGELWKLWYTSVPAPEGMAAEITGDWPSRTAAPCCPSPRGCLTRPRVARAA